MYKHLLRSLVCEISVLLVATFTCPRGQYNSFLPDPNDCRGYFHCISDGRYYHKTCSYGLRFDSRHKICNWASLVACEENFTQRMAVSEEGTREESIQDPFYIKPYLSLPDIEKQENWQKPFNKKKESNDLQVDGSGDVGAESFVDRNLNVIGKNNTKDDTAINGPTVKCRGSFSFLTDPVRCDVFYQCYMWIPYPKVCPKGLYFDDFTFVCNWPHLVNCRNGIRKALFEQIQVDHGANQIQSIQNTLIHSEKKALLKETGNKNNIPRKHSFYHSKTNLEPKLERKYVVRKTTKNNYPSSTKFISSKDNSTMNSYLTSLRTTQSSKEKRSKILNSRFDPHIITPTTQIFNRKMTRKTHLPEIRRSNNRKLYLENFTGKETRSVFTQHKSILFPNISTGENTYLRRNSSNSIKDININNTSENKSILPSTFRTGERFDLRRSFSNKSKDNNTNVGNFSQKKEIKTRNERNKGHRLKLQCIELNCTDSNRTISIDNDERFSLIKNSSDSDKIIKRNLNDFLVNDPKSHLKNDSEMANNKVLTGEPFFKISNSKNQSVFKSLSNDQPLLQFYPSKTTMKTKSSLNGYKGKLSIFLNQNDSRNNFSSEKPANESEVFVKLINKKETDETNLGQPLIVLQKESEIASKINISEDLNDSFNMQNDSIMKTDFDTDSKKKTNLTSLFLKENFQTSKKVNNSLADIPVLLVSDNQNLINVDYLENISESSTHSVVQDSHLELIPSTESSFDETKNESSSTKNTVLSHEVIKSNITKQRKVGIKQNNNNSIDLIKHDIGSTTYYNTIGSSIVSSIISKNEVQITDIPERHSIINDRRARNENNGLNGELLTKEKQNTNFNTKDSIKNDLRENYNNVTKILLDPVSKTSTKSPNKAESDIKVTHLDNVKKAGVSKFIIHKTDSKRQETFKKFLYRKLENIFNHFVPKQIDMDRILTSKTITNILPNQRNDKKLVGLKKKTSKRNLDKIDISEEETTRPEYLEWKNQFNETADIRWIFLSGNDSISKNILTRQKKKINKTVADKNTLLKPHSMNNVKESLDFNKIDDKVFLVTKNTSLQLNKSDDYLKDLPRKRMLINNSKELGSNISKNFHENLQNNLKNDFFSNTEKSELKITTSAVSFDENKRNARENGSEKLKIKSSYKINTKILKNNTNYHTFYDKALIDKDNITSNTPIPNLSHENKTSKVISKKNDTGTKSSYFKDLKAMKRNSDKNIKIYGEMLRPFNKSVLPSLLNDITLEERNENLTKKIEYFRNDTLNDIWNISENETKYLDNNITNISSVYQKTTSNQRSNKIDLRKKDGVKKQNYIISEPKFATEIQEESEEVWFQGSNNTDVLITTEKQEPKASK